RRSRAGSTQKLPHSSQIPGRPEAVLPVGSSIAGSSVVKGGADEHLLAERFNGRGQIRPDEHRPDWQARFDCQREKPGNALQDAKSVSAQNVAKAAIRID